MSEGTHPPRTCAICGGVIQYRTTFVPLDQGRSGHPSCVYPVPVPTFPGRQREVTIEENFTSGRIAGLREAAEMAEAFPARTHGALATAPYAAAEQAAEEIAAAILARIAELEKP